MENINALYKALEQADAAGNTAVAQQLADQIRTLSTQEDAVTKPALATQPLTTKPAAPVAEDINALYKALEQADAAGDTELAQQLADKIRSLPVQETPVTPPTPTPAPKVEPADKKPTIDVMGQKFTPEEYAKYSGMPIAAKPGEQAKGAFSGAFGRSIYNLAADLALAYGKATGNVEQAEEEAKRLREYGDKTYTNTTKGWKEDPIAKIQELAGGSAPYMLGPITAALGSTALGATGLAATVAPMVASTLQFTGSNLQRQMDQNKKLADTNLLKAGALAIPAAALDQIGFRFIPGIKRIFGAAGKEITDEAANALVKKSILAKAGEKALATGEGMAIEGGTEAAQQLLERLQAGLSITDAEARKEYFDSFVGGAVLAGTLGVSGQAIESAASRLGQPKPIVKEKEIEPEPTDEEQRPSRETLKKEFLAELEAEANEINRVKAEEAAKLANINLPTISQEGAIADQGKLFNVVGGPSVEVGKPIIVGPLDDTTLTSWGLGKNSKAYKTLIGKDVSLPDNRALLDDALEAHPGKINEEAVETYKSLLDEPKAEATDAGFDLGTTTISDAVSGQSRYGTPGGTEGRFGPAINISGTPTEITETGKEGVDTPLETKTPEVETKPISGFTAEQKAKVKNRIDDIKSFINEYLPLHEKIQRSSKPRVSERDKRNELSDRLTRNLIESFSILDESILDKKTELGRALGDLFNYSGRHNVVKTNETLATIDNLLKPEETAVEEQPLTNELQEAKKLIGQLNTLDPGNELIQDLSELTVDQPTINKARQTVNQLLAARKAKVGKTLTPAEKAELTPDEFNVEDVKGTVEENQPDVIATTTKAKNLGQALNILQTEHADKTSDAEKALINKLINVPNLKNTKYQVDTVNKAKNTTFRGTFNSLLNKVRIDKSIGNIKSILHEAVHSATVAALRKSVFTKYSVNKQLKNAGLQPHEYTTSEHVGKTEAGKRMVKIYNTAYKAWADTVFTDKPKDKPYGLKDIFEFTSEALSNPDFQKFLASLPSIEGGKAKVSSLWDDFVEGIKKLLNLGDISNTLLNDLISVVPELMEGPKTGIFERIKDEASTAETYIFEQRTPKSKLDDDLKKSGTVAKEVAPEPTTFDRFKEAPIKTIDEMVANFRKNFFSFDAALNNKILIAMRQQGISQKEIAKSFYEIQLGQALHADHLADMWMVHGGIAYDPKSFSFVIEDLANSMSTIRDDLKELAEKYNVSEYEMYQYGNAAFVASRSQSLKESNDALRDRIRDLLVKGKKAEAAKVAEKGFKLVHLTPAEIKRGMNFFKTIPELNDIKNTWNINRERLLNFAVKHGLYTEEKAEELLDIIDFVPFYREQQAEANKVPKPFTRGIIDTAVDKRLKGSYRPVHNVFDNMERWSRYILKKSINNQAAQSKIKFYSKYIPDDIKTISGDSKTGNAVGVWYDGKVVKYEFQGYDGKSMVDGFTGLEPVVNLTVPAFLNKYAAFQRAQIVLEPLFNFAQITMDAFDTLITSGIELPVLIPLQVVKEILLSPFGLSKARTYLKKTGDVGKRDWASEYSKIDIEGMKQLKELKTSDKMIQGILSPVKYGIKGLKFLGMASDNIIRQALWSQIMLETGDVARATYVAREIINFRRTGSNAYISAARQMAPFVNANLQAANVAFGTMLLSGITPDTKLTQFRRLITNGAQVTAAVLILTALNADDDDYKKLDPKDRDRLLIIPGSGGYALPVRGSIITAIYKITPEHLFNRYVEESEDSEKLKKGLAEAFKRAIVMPTGFPTLLTPLLELSMNIDTVTGLPLRGQSQKDLESDLQYSNKYTSQLARWANDATGVSPIVFQNFMNRWLASTSMLISMFTNKLIADIRGEILPEKTFKEMFLQLPSANKFLTKQQNTRNINDFYELNDIVNAVVDSANKYKDIDYDKFTEYQAKDNNAAIIDMRSELATISRDLANLRKWENKVYSSKDTGQWTPQTKKQELDRIEQVRQDILGHEQNVKDRLDRRIQNLRRQGGL